MKICAGFLPFHYNFLAYLCVYHIAIFINFGTLYYVCCLFYYLFSMNHMPMPLPLPLPARYTFCLFSWPVEFQLLPLFSFGTVNKKDI